ncbi:tail assembly protein [Pectobacterium aroidearum]|uniref:Tail assembly protein n=1 Tax=Pectobacterium aroidearum TaxID=1201031 RepID=A0ABR5ZJH8_9GAMM|nr:tail assembly protein [Pectobacterium aroidearum]MBA5234742.1 tail assembly protein [Pectobacterium aroidearum]MBA5739921.1 tail assembly protein [Pectobacterium aroidearum]
MSAKTKPVERLTEIRLSGKLGRTFGRSFMLSVASVREAVRALCIQIPGFEQFLNRSEAAGLTYAVFNGKQNVSKEALQLDGVQPVIRLIPVIIGSKKSGVFQTILGAALVAVGFVLSFTPAAAASPFLYKLGAATMLGGVAQMLAPQGTRGLTDTARDTRKSYAFGTPTNTSAAGRPVPYVFGRTLIGGPIISGGIFVEQEQ